MKHMKGFRVPFATSAAPAASKIERSKSQLQPIMSGTTASSKLGVLPANLMSPTSKEALRLHLKILKLQREAKGSRKMYKKDQDELYRKLTIEKARLETFER